MLIRNTIYMLLVMLLISSAACKADPEPARQGNGGGTEEPDPDPDPDPVKPSDFSGDYLVATDNLGRVLPLYGEAGARKNDRQIGLFYWLWHGDLRNESATDYDVTKLLQQDPARTQWEFADYYWTEPELGYYRSLDEFVMRRHLQLFCLVGIDFLYLDFTNAIVDAPELKLLLKLIKEFQSKGYDPPKLVPFLNHEPVPKIEQLYRDFYSDSQYSDCWFLYKGKPLMLSPQKHPTNQIINNYFTWRHMWAAFEATPETRERWRFFDQVPMRPAYHNGSVEQIVVAPGFGGPNWDNHIYGAKSSTTTHAPTYDIYWKTPDTGKGLFFEEQWNAAHRIGAPVLCITGWNEWKAGAWHADQGLVNAGFKFQGRLLSVGESYFVDEFNEEFNRDLEPQLGEYTDNYFYQMAAHLRRYKGMKPLPEASAPKTIGIDGVFTEWTDVKPGYEDFEGDVIRRNHTGAPKGTSYSDNTGRNDIIESRVAYDDHYVYFYVRTAKDLTSWEDPFWMHLYIDSDMDKNTGWEGYDFAVNLSVRSAARTTLSRRGQGGWEEAAQCDYCAAGNQMEIAVPREMLGQGTSPEFYFHWVDNIRQQDDIHEFFVHGDSAPERRYNYYYKAQ